MNAIRDWHTARRFSPVFAFAFAGGDFIEQASGDRRMLNYAKPLELDPDHLTSVVMTGVLYLDLGREDMTVELYEKSIDLTKNPGLKNLFQHWIESIRGSRMAYP